MSQRPDPVMHDAEGWWYFDEYCERVGPFRTEHDARLALPPYLRDE